jgi:hypothetical protein
LGATEGAAAVYSWSRFGPVQLSAAVLPWLAIVGLCFLKPNRRPQAWLIGLPLLAVMGLGLASRAALGFIEEAELRSTLEAFVAALGFGWAATLLLAECLARGRTVARFMGQLVAFGAFSLLALAARGKWGGIDMLSTFCAVALPFMTFAAVTTASLAGWSCRRQFTGWRFSLWLPFWLAAVWVTMVLPLVVLHSLSEGGELVSILGFTGGCFAVSVVVVLPFLALCLISPLYRQRLQGLVGAESAASEATTCESRTSE